VALAVQVVTHTQILIYTVYALALYAAFELWLAGRDPPRGGGVRRFLRDALILLPVPVMDGGRIVLDCIAGIRRRNLTDKELNWAAGIGWAMIGALVLFTIFNDILKLLHK